MDVGPFVRTLDYVAIALCIIVMCIITTIFIRRQINFPSPVNVFGGLSSFVCLVISCVATVYLVNPNLPCDFRAAFMAPLYWSCNMFLFCHFFAKSRLLVGVLPEDSSYHMTLKHPFKRSTSYVLRLVDIIFLAVMISYFFAGVTNFHSVYGVRSAVTNLCTTGKPGLAQFINVALVVLGNFMCLFAFVIPLRRLTQKSRQRSTTGKSLARQQRLIKRTCIAIAVSITSLICCYTVLLLSNDSVLATFYIDFMITQSVQLMSILPPKETSKPGKVAIMSTKGANSNKITSTAGVMSTTGDYGEQSNLEYGADY